MSSTDSNELPLPQGLRFYLAIAALNFANCVSFFDITGITILLPAVAQHWGPESSIPWIPTAQLICATVGQCVLGYLSDVWSRRTVLLLSLSILCMSALVGGLGFFASNAGLFLAARAFSGTATGSISSVVNVSQSDITTRDQRLKWQGAQGLSVALGSILGMVVGAVFTQRAKPELPYYIEAGLVFTALIMVYYFVEARCPHPADFLTAWKGIDLAGIASGAGCVVAGLILLTKYDTINKLVIGLLAGTALGCATLFLFLGFRKHRSTRPIVPFDLFRSRTIAVIYLQNLMFGAAYYTLIFFTPMFFHNAYGAKSMQIVEYMLPYFVCHGLWSTVSAQLVLWSQNKEVGSYRIIFVFGFSVWTLSMSLLAWRATNPLPIPATVVLVAIVGLGTGSVFQNSVGAILAEVDSIDGNKDRNAVALGARNVLRFLGGAIGTATGATILKVALRRGIPSRLNQYWEPTFANDKVDTLSGEDSQLVRAALAIGLRWVFCASAVALALCLLLSFLIKEPPKEQKKNSDIEMKRMSGGSTLAEEDSDSRKEST